MATTKSFIGKGSIYIREKNASEGLFPLGNCSTLELAISEDKQEQKDFENAGGATVNTVSRIDSITASITALSISGNNIALALRGVVTMVAAAAVTDESHTAYLGGFIPFNKLLDASTAVAVTNAAGTTTFVQDTDYIIKNSGIQILAAPATAALTDGLAILIDYMGAASLDIEPVTATGVEHELVFDGLNEADSGKPVSIVMHRIKFNPTQALALIGDEFAELPLTLDLLKDPAIIASGTSPFIKIQQVQ